MPTSPSFHFSLSLSLSLSISLSLSLLSPAPHYSFPLSFNLSSLSLSVSFLSPSLLFLFSATLFLSSKPSSPVSPHPCLFHVSLPSTFLSVFQALSFCQCQSPSVGLCNWAPSLERKWLHLKRTVLCLVLCESVREGRGRKRKRERVERFEGVWKLSTKWTEKHSSIPLPPLSREQETN